MHGAILHLQHGFMACAYFDTSKTLILLLFMDNEICEGSIFFFSSGKA